MLNPCRPCVCVGAPCEQCMFGYLSAETTHNMMRELIVKVLAGEKPPGWKNAEYYMELHVDWKDQFRDGEQNKDDLVEYSYEVGIGGGTATGSVWVPENATDDEIRLAIMDDLYYVEYEKIEEE